MSSEPQQTSVLDKAKHVLASATTLPRHDEVSDTPNIKLPPEDIHEIKGPHGHEVATGPKYLLALDETPDSELAMKYALEHFKPNCEPSLLR